jgi:acetyl-CoA C-acetyltransferase
MGASADAVHAREGISRAEQDCWAAESHRRAAAATAEGRFSAELVAMPAAADIAASVGDECIRAATTVARLGELPPAFGPDGTVTAGNASQLSDGAAAVVVMARQRAERDGHEILAEIVAHSMVAGPDATLHPQPVNAIRRILARSGYSRSQIDLFEINEAFAGVAVFAARELELPHDRVNVNGGAVALGHPLGCTGARLLVTLVHALRRRGGGVGIATLCGGGGQGEALLVRVG